MQTTAELPVVEKMLILTVVRKQLFLAIGFDNMILTKQFLLHGEKKTQISVSGTKRLFENNWIEREHTY